MTARAAEGMRNPSSNDPRAIVTMPGRGAFSIVSLMRVTANSASASRSAARAAVPAPGTTTTVVPPWAARSRASAIATEISPR